MVILSTYMRIREEEEEQEKGEKRRWGRKGEQREESTCSVPQTDTDLFVVTRYIHTMELLSKEYLSCKM